MKDDYIEAWTEDDGNKVDPVVQAVKAAKAADDEEYATAFKTDEFDKPKKKDGESEEGDA